MANSVIKTSFASGEVSPSLYGRPDLAKHNTGAALIRNFLIDYRGGAISRPGTKLVTRTKTSGKIRLINFEFNILQTYVLEFGNRYMRVLQNGSPVLEPGFIITGITNGDLIVSAPGHNFIVGDWVYISGVNGMNEVNYETYIVGSVSFGNVTLTSLDGDVQNSSGYGVYLSGGSISRVFTLVTPYVEDDLIMLKYIQSADVLTLTHRNYPVMNLTRTAHHSWALTEVNFSATVVPPTGLNLTTTGAGTVSFSYCVTAVSAIDGSESIACKPVIVQSVNIGTTSGTITVKWNAVPNAAYYNIYKAQVSPSVDIPAGSTHGYVGMSYGLQFNDGNILADFTKTPPKHRNPFAKASLTDITITNGGSGYLTSSSVTVTDATGSGAVVFPIVEGGIIVGFIIEDQGHDYTAPVVSVSDGTGAVLVPVLGKSSGNYPGVATYFQQRKVYASSINQPETLWGSHPGAFNNFDVSTPVVADDAYTLTLASRQVNEIKSMLAMPGGLVILTGGGAWQITGGGQNTAVTPMSAQAQPQAYNGCSDVPPLAINYEILYVQNKGSAVRDLSYNFFSNIYTGTDLSIISSHLFDGYQITEWAWAEEPYKIVWAVRDDGKLLTLTFLKEQEVAGWARQDTRGLFGSITSVTEGHENAVYISVNRYINGRWVQFIERFASRLIETVEDAWCVDCGLENVQETPNATITVSSTQGTVTIEASSGVFSAQNVGDVLRVCGGIIDVTTFVGPTTLEGVVRKELTDILLDAKAGEFVPLPKASGDWQISTPTATVYGLSHLEGELVQVVSDGNVLSPRIVSGGKITLDQPATKIIVGLGFQCQLQTLNLDIGEPTIQGKRKKIAAATVRVDKTRGMKVGPTFAKVVEYKHRNRGDHLGDPIDLMSGDMRVVLEPQYSIEGRICVQQDYPLPITVLAIIPEIILGDTDPRK